MKRTNSAGRKAWWASLTPEQRAAHILKQKVGIAAAFARRRQQDREWLRRILPPGRGIKRAP